MTIATLSSATPSRWGELTSCARPSEPKPKAVGNKPSEAETAEREGKGPRRSPLFSTIRDALEQLVATEASSTAPTDDDAASTGGSDELDQALDDFARALMHALHDGRGPHGEDRGRHLGLALGRPAWSSAAQRLEAIAGQVAPEPAAPAAEAPVEATPPEVVEAGGDTPALASTPTTSSPSTPTPSLHLTLELPESPWAAVHDGLIESFAEVQRALGRPDSGRDDAESLEERLREMLVALAAKLRASTANTAALAPPGSLLSVVA